MDALGMMTKGILKGVEIPSTPTIPTLVIVDQEDATGATATISGADAGSSNIANTMKYGEDSWTEHGPIIGNGNIDLVLGVGNYYAYVSSTASNLTVNGILQKFRVTGAALDPDFTNITVHSCAEILAAYLINAELFTKPSIQGLFPLYISSMPDGKGVESDCGCIYDTPGIKDGRLMMGINVLRYGIQIRIRSVVYNDGLKKIEDVATALEEVRRNTIELDNITYQINNVSQTSPVIPLGQEEGTQRRELFTVNFLISIKEI